MHLSDLGELIEVALEFEAQLGEYNVGFALCTITDLVDSMIESQLLIDGYVNSSYDNIFVSYPESYYFMFCFFFLFLYLAVFSFLLISQYRFKLENNVYLSIMLLFSFSAWFEYSFSYLNYSSVTHNGKYIQLFAAGAHIFGDSKVLSCFYFVMTLMTAKDLTEQKFITSEEPKYKKCFLSFAVSYLLYRVVYYGNMFTM